MYNIWEHIVSLNYRITWWIFTKLGRDKVLMTPVHLYWLLGQIRPGWIQGRAMMCQWGALLQRTSSSDWKATEVYFWHVLMSCIGLNHFHLFSFKYFNWTKYLIYMNLCTFHVKKNSARLQWYSCARYKAPGPLVYIWKLDMQFVSCFNCKVQTRQECRNTYLNYVTINLSTHNHNDCYRDKR